MLLHENTSSDTNCDNNNRFIISCARKDCLYTWRYNGHAVFFPCCPRCRRNNRIPRNTNMDKKVPLQHEQVGRLTHAGAAVVTYSIPGVKPDTL
jgi:hypothetical protein